MSLSLHGLQRSIKGFDLLAELSASVDETKDMIIEYNRNQLLRGLDKQGNYLSPKYSEDPYFKSTESARRYAEWKKVIEPGTDKPFDVPNLYITGRFHESIRIDVAGSDMNFTSGDPNAGSIEGKFTEVIYGLNDESKKEYIPEFLFPALKRRIESKTVLRLT